MSRLFSRLVSKLDTTSTTAKAMEIHALSDKEMQDRGMKRIDVARAIMLNTAW
jgi:hypothetical protein